MIDRILVTFEPGALTAALAHIEAAKEEINNITGISDADPDFDKVEAVYAGIDMASKPDRTAYFANGFFVPPPVEPLTFSVRPGFPAWPLEEAVIRTRMGWELKPNRELVGSDFADYGDRILLAELGYFSVDLPKHRTKRNREAQRVAYLEEAYDVLLLNREEQHRLIARRMEAGLTSGIWARSTRAYGQACDALDEAVLSQSPAIAKSIEELSE